MMLKNEIFELLSEFGFKQESNYGFAYFFSHQSLSTHTLNFDEDRGYKFSGLINGGKFNSGDCPTQDDFIRWLKVKKMEVKLERDASGY
jgi:hypothetical protein